MLEGYVEGMINLEGGGGTSDYAALQNKPSINNVELEGNKTTEDLNISYDDLQNKPSINNVTLEGNKTTEDLNISYDDLQNKPTIRNMPDSSGAAAGDVLTHTSNGDLWQPPVTGGGLSVNTLYDGYANSAGTYNLSGSIDEYDAVLVVYWGYYISLSNKEQLASSLIYKDDYYAASANNWTHLLQGNDTRRIVFYFPTNSSFEIIQSLEGAIYKIYGIKQGGSENG